MANEMERAHEDLLRMPPGIYSEWNTTREIIFNKFKEQSQEEKRSAHHGFRPLYLTSDNEELYLSKKWIYLQYIPMLLPGKLCVITGVPETLSLQEIISSIPKKDMIRVGHKHDGIVHLEYFLRHQASSISDVRNTVLRQCEDLKFF